MNRTIDQVTIRDLAFSIWQTMVASRYYHLQLFLNYCTQNHRLLLLEHSLLQRFLKFVFDGKVLFNHLKSFFYGSNTGSFSSFKSTMFTNWPFLGRNAMSWVWKIIQNKFCHHRFVKYCHLFRNINYWKLTSLLLLRNLCQNHEFDDFLFFIFL